MKAGEFPGLALLAVVATAAAFGYDARAQAAPCPPSPVIKAIEFGHANKDGGAARLAWSHDHAQTWTFADWDLAEFGLVGFVNFGRGYRGARDGFVYAYSHDGPRADVPADHFVLMRAPKEELKRRQAWSFFAGFEAGGQPVWNSDINARRPVFRHPGACLRSAMTYHPGLRRYLWWQQIPQPLGHPDRGDTRFEGGFGIYDAPEPWGPWTTVFHTAKWDTGPGEHADFPAKWMSPDGRTAWLVFSGDDAFSLRKATFVRAGEAAAHPRCPGPLRAHRDRGIYVSVMLFGGHYECRGGWRGNPFHAANNINGVNGDPNGDGDGLETQTLRLPDVIRIQDHYVHKVIDTVNDLDNVLFEIANEGDAGSKEWQRRLIRLIHEYEAPKPKQHPVGMTAVWDNDNEILVASGADWISPSTGGPEGLPKLPPADGRKVSLLDSDHWFVQPILNDPEFGRDWVWKAFCDGHNPILMENIPEDSGSEIPVTTNDPGYVASRRAMGETRRVAARINLATMTPEPRLSSTGHCLAATGTEYLVYLPGRPTPPLTVELSHGKYAVEWYNLRTSAWQSSEPIAVSSLFR